MNYFVLSALFNFIVCVGCAAVIFLQNPSSKKNRPFALYSLSGGLWQFFYVLWLLSTNGASALFFVRTQMIFCSLIPGFHLQGIIRLFDIETPFRRRILQGIFIAASICALFGYSPYFIPRTEPRLGFPYWPVPGLFIHIIFIIIFIPVMFLVYLIWEFRRREKSPMVRNQLLWLVLATLISYGGGATNVPLWYHIPFKPYGNASVWTAIVVSSLIFFRLGLLDVTLMFRDILNYLLTTLLLGSFLGGAAFLITKNMAVAAGVLLTALVVPTIYQLFHHRIRHFFDRFFWPKESQSSENLSVTIEKIKESTYTYDDLARNIVQSLVGNLPIEMASVYFYDFTKKEYQLRAQEGMKNPGTENLKLNRSLLALAAADPLVLYLAHRKEVLLYDALQAGLLNPDQDEAIFKSMARMEAQVCAPLLFTGRMMGIIALGKKKTKKIFNRDDLSVIKSVAHMAEEVMHSVMGMETELRNTALYSHDLDNDSRALLQTLDFLQSPMAENLPKEKLNQFHSQMVHVVEQLAHVFKSNRDRSSLILKSIRGEYEKKPFSVFPLVRSSLEKFRMMAGKDHVDLSAALPEKEIKIYGNPDDFIRVVDNLLGNALRYATTSGRITVQGEEAQGFFRLQISDNGEGIAAEDLSRIWDMGFQAKSSKKGSSGFGLSIAKQIVELHQGTITAQSEGKGKGTTFTIEIPLLDLPQLPPDKE